MTWDEAIKTVLTETDGSVWFGDPDTWHLIYETKYPLKQHPHPMHKWDLVRQALYRSKVVKVDGYIRSIGWCGYKEYLHSHYVLI